MPPKKAAPAKSSKTSSRAQPAKTATPASAAVPKANKRKAAEEIDEPEPKKAKATDAPASKTTKKTATAKTTTKKAAATKSVASKPAAAKPAAKKAAPKEEAPKPVATKAPAKKTATTKKATTPTPAAKPVKAAKVAKVAKPAPPKKAAPIINTPPTQKLDIYVFGEGSSGELGLGSVKYDGKMPIDVKRPRINENLSSKTVGVVQIAVGGMHCAALTHDNKILTWGVNDQGALGRDTTWSGGLKDIDAKEDSDSDSDDDDDDTGMNPRESTPTQVDSAYFPEGTTFASLVCSDSATFALTTDGLVYGWGTFRGNDGILGFREGINSQRTPALIPELKNITGLATGTNHVLAVSAKGKVFGWGAGEQNQLARRVVSRTAAGALIPREFGLQRKNITYVACGDYHSFAMDNKGNVYSWGLNTFGQTGIPKEDEEDNAINVPTLVENLKEYEIKQISGGSHHTISCTKTGEVLVWGRIDNAQGGMDVSKFPKDKLFIDENERPRYLIKPAVIPGLDAAAISAGADHCLVITNDGKAYSWGFSGNYQTGQGTTEDIKEATHIGNTALAGKHLVWAGAGGQFSALAGKPQDTQMANGI